MSSGGIRALVGVVSQRLKAAARWMGLNPEVGKDVFFDRAYRPGPVSAPPRDFSLSYPTKSENLADVRYAERSNRLKAQADEKRHFTPPEDPLADPRNMFNARSLQPISVDHKPYLYFEAVDPFTGKKINL